jgi:hypothetical protein
MQNRDTVGLQVLIVMGVGGALDVDLGCSRVIIYAPRIKRRSN